MNKIITLESGQELLLAANGATPIRYKMVFGSDLMVEFNQITNGKKDEGEAADVIQKLAFIMNNQAVTPKEELAKLNMENYVEWLEDFMPLDLFKASGEIIEIYTGNNASTSKPKKASGRPAEK